MRHHPKEFGAPIAIATIDAPSILAAGIPSPYSGNVGVSGAAPGARFGTAHPAATRRIQKLPGRHRSASQEGMAAASASG